MIAPSKVSIVIPVYNREDLVRYAIESALGQTYSDIEVVIVDNCSTDKTFDIVQEYARKDSRVRAFRNEQNVGPVKNWIRCAQHSRGEFIKILYSDDWLESDAVERLVEPLAEHNDVGFSYSSVDIHFEDGTINRAYQMAHSKLLPSFEFVKAEFAGFLPVPVSPGCAMFRQEDVIAGLIEHIPNKFGIECNRRGMGNDLMLFLKTCTKYPYVYYVADRLSHFRAHQSSFTIEISISAPTTGKICYNNTKAYFLATAPLEVAQRRLLQTLLLVSILRSELDMANGSKFKQYERLFPDNYPYYYELDLRVIPVLFRWLLRWLEAKGKLMCDKLRDRRQK